MTWDDLFYWGVFGVLVVVWIIWAYAVLFGFGSGYTRSSVESTPTGKDGRH